MSEANSGIKVTGSGRASIPPDRARIEMGVSTLADSVAAAAARAQERARALVGVLSETGVSREDIRTSSYRVEPEYRHEDGKRSLVGFRVTNSMTITARDLDAVGELIDRAVAVGGDDAVVGNVEFEVEDLTAAATAARASAWHDARSKAEQLADLSGATLGGVVSITETTGRPPGPGPLARFAAESDSTPIAPGVSTVEVRLEVEFQLDA